MPISNHSEIISQHLFVKLVNHCCQLGYILVKVNNKRITHVKYFFVVCVRVLIITLQLAVMQKTRLCLDSCSILKLFTFIQFNDMYYGQCMIELTWTIFKNSLSNEGEKKTHHLSEVVRVNQSSHRNFVPQLPHFKPCAVPMQIFPIYDDD